MLHCGVFANGRDRQTRIEQTSSEINHQSEVYEVTEAKEPDATKENRNTNNEIPSADRHNSTSHTSYTQDDRYISTINSPTAKTGNGVFPKNLMHDPDKLLDGMKVLHCLFCSSYKTPIEFDMTTHLQQTHISDLVDTFPAAEKACEGFRNQLICQMMVVTVYKQ